MLEFGTGHNPQDASSEGLQAGLDQKNRPSAARAGGSGGTTSWQGCGQ